MTRRDTSWHAEAKRLRAEPHSLTMASIAARLGKTVGAVQWAVAPRKRDNTDRIRPGREKWCAARAPRPIRAILPPPEVKAEAIRRAAKGEICAAELGRILRGEAAP